MRLFILILSLYCFSPPIHAQNKLSKAKLAISLQQYSLAIDLLTPLAKQENADACYMLAGLHKSGKGTPSNHKIAHKWYQCAAKKKHKLAYFQLGLLYEKGWGVQRDPQRALHYYQLAAEQKVRPATQAIQRIKTRKLNAEDLFQASKNGWLAAVKQAVDSGLSINTTNKNKQTPLMLAIQNQHLQLITWLLNKDANTNIQDQQKRYPLQYAWETHNFSIIKQLAAHGCEHIGPSGNPVLVRAIQSEHSSWVIPLIKQGCNPYQTDLYGKNLLQLAQQYQRAELSQQLTKLGLQLPELNTKHASILPENLSQKLIIGFARNGQLEELKQAKKLHYDLKKQDKEQRTLLHWSVAGQHHKTSKWLLEQGINPYLLDQHKQTALDLALINKDKQHLNILFSTKLQDSQHIIEHTLPLAIRYSQQGFAVQLIQSLPELRLIKHQRSLLFLAIRNHATKVVDSLHKRGVPLAQTDRQGQTLLDLAVISADKDIVKYLLNKHLDPNHVSKDGRTALLLCAEKSTTAICKFLIKAGAKIHQQTNEKENALWLASARGEETLVAYFLSLNMDFKSRNSAGLTPLLIATINQHLNTCKLLINAGADPKRPGSQGKSAVDIANSSNNSELIHLFNTID